MRVLVACEFSGIVRDAFLARGHDAWSCDILPTEAPGPHIQADVLAILDRNWDLMIAFPPCTYLANSGARWLYKEDGDMDGERWAGMVSGSEFFNELLGEDIFGKAYHIPKIAIENPIQHEQARKRIRKYDQLIQPWQFGHGETKATCLWLKGLPRLLPTFADAPLFGVTPIKERVPRVHYESPGPERSKNRSRTYRGIAEAMADQWG